LLSSGIFDPNLTPTSPFRGKFFGRPRALEERVCLDFH
jgi:hypothetical protein